MVRPSRDRSGVPSPRPQRTASATMQAPRHGRAPSGDDRRRGELRGAEHNDQTADWPNRAQLPLPGRPPVGRWSTA